MNTALTTADLAAAEKAPAVDRDDRDDRRERGEPKQRPTEDAAAPADDRRKSTAEDDELAPLFSSEMTKDFRGRWDAIQTGFVDDPKQAARQGDELVAQVMRSLTESFSKERAKLEGQLEQPDEASTENLRVALRRYRSFFKRLLSL
jgi:hypothetical protein